MRLWASSNHSDCLSQLVDSARSLAGEHILRDVVLGCFYTAVRIDSGEVGLCYCGDAPKSSLADTRLFQNTKVCHIFDELDGGPSESVSIALASANALFTRHLSGDHPGDVLHSLELKKDDVVGMIGNFAPLVPRLEPAVGKLLVFERPSKMKPGFHFESDLARLLPQCTVAIITSSTLFNGSLPNILPLLHGCREAVLLGASTPMAQQVFSQTPITLLSGVQITDADNVLSIVKNEGGMLALKPYVRKTNIRVWHKS